MRKLTNKEIEKRAVMEVINYFEPQVDELIKQSAVELEKLNKCREAQSMHQKIRIDGLCIKNAINTINSKKDSYLQSYAGGNKEKNGNFLKKHSQDSDALMEVA